MPFGRPVDIHAYADRIVIRQDGRMVAEQDGRMVAEHPRSYGRGETIYGPRNYVPCAGFGAQARRLA